MKSMGKPSSIGPLCASASRAALGVAFLLYFSAIVTGCGSRTGTTTTSPPPGNFEFSGKVMGGQQPVSGAEVKIFVAGSSGYGTGATQLGPTGHTDESGGFLLQGTVSCPSSSAPAYVTATGGHTGTGQDNAAIAMMAALGSCGSLNGSSAVINEVTTVAGTWALAPFLGAGGQMGTSSGNAQGLANAFSGASSLADVSSGVTPGKSAPSNAVIPAAKINTLADILSACVEQSSANACGTLFAAATPPGGSAPGNTLDAALNLARHPALSPSALFALAGSASPFQPVLAAAPPDWMLPITLTGAGLNLPGSIGIDGAGNVWVANYSKAVAEFSTIGAALSPATGFTGGGLNESFGLAVNTDGNVWVTNEQTPGVNSGGGSVTVLTPSGQPVSGAGGYFGGGVYFPLAVAADTDGTVWVADYGDSTATKFSMTGTALSPSTGFAPSQMEGPVAVAVDANHTAWFANQGGQNGSVSSVSADGSKVNMFDCGGAGPSGIAVDANAVAAEGSTGHLWTANYYSDSVSELALRSDGSATVVGTPSTGGGILRPNGIAVDGAGNVWVTNFRGNSISELEGAKTASAGTVLSPAAGFGSDAPLISPFAVAIDASGNVWVSNQGGKSIQQGNQTTQQFMITEFPGAATPVKTPVIGPPQLP
jgi:sugar lactone lactonase YvrE